MHSLWVRGNAVVFFGIANLMMLCVAMGYSTYFHTNAPGYGAQALDVELKGLRNFRDVDRAIVTFNTSFDLSSVYNWNVKQIFVFLVAEYASPSNRRNEVVIWDHVAQTPQDAVHAAQEQYNKYALIDQYDELRGRDVTFKLKWDTMPMSGSLYLAEVPRGSVEVRLPKKYL